MHLKKLTLVFASLLLVAFSFNFTKSSTPSSSIQNKTIQWVTLAADDLEDDDFDNLDFPSFSILDFRSCLNNDDSKIRNYSTSVDLAIPAVPCYLLVRNFRI
ncbi:MAG TPA: hypothetical protein DGG95_14745 [Cytophagales bacterium]|jgi:hypothetical protein|nr:hypothetical protein [Cytophagales bacterium]